MLVVVTTLNTIYYKKKVNDNYTLDCLTLLTLMLMFTYEVCSILTIIFTLLAISIELIIDKIIEKRVKYVKKTRKKEINLGFYLCVTNIITLITTNFIMFYR